MKQQFEGTQGQAYPQKMLVYKILPSGRNPDMYPQMFMDNSGFFLKHTYRIEVPVIFQGSTICMIIYMG